MAAGGGSEGTTAEATASTPRRRPGLPRTSSSSTAATQYEQRQRSSGRFASTGGGQRERISASLAPATHAVLAQLAETSGLPRSYVIDACLALLAQRPELLTPVLAQLGQAHEAGELPAIAVFDQAAALLSAGTSSSTPARRRVQQPGVGRGNGKQPHPQHQEALEMLLALRQPDGTWERGAIASIATRLGLGRQTVWSWAQRLEAPAPTAATEIARESQNGAAAPDRELALA
jgi:hypothetical protein